jgi:hypothetical protein
VPDVVQLGAEARARLAAMRATEAAGPAAALVGNPDEGLLYYQEHDGEDDEVDEGSEEWEDEGKEEEELSQTDHLNKSLLESFKARLGLGRPALSPCAGACDPVL